MSADDELYRWAGAIHDGIVHAVDTGGRTCTVTVARFGPTPQGPAPYTPQVFPADVCDVRHPARGDRCCVLETLDGRFWVAGWHSNQEF